MSFASRERLLAGLAILALLVAAFLMPPLGPAAGGGGSGSDGGGEDGMDPIERPGEPGTEAERTPGEPGTPPDGIAEPSDPGDGERPTGEPGVSVRPGGEAGEGERNGDGDGTGLNVTGAEPHPECFVVVWDSLAPGRNATVFQWHGGSPVADQQVWFEGDQIGPTNEAGRADGRVPYVQELRLTAEAPPVDRCAVLHLRMPASIDNLAETGSGPVEVLVDEEASLETVAVADGNVTTTLPVSGEASLAVEGEPYPGSEVRLNATIDGAPMPDATVSVDGETRGTTDERGHYNLTVPDDGTEQLAVGVSRGEFAAETSISVLVLSLDLRADSLLALPGGSATVRATVGDRPAGGVRVQGADQVVRTGADGQAAVQLPADPRAAFTAEGHGQVATAPVWPVYLPTVLLVVFGVALVVGTLVGSARRESGPATATIGGAWLLLGAVVTALVLGGPTAALGVAVLAALALAVRYRGRLAAGLDWLRRTAVAAVFSVHGAARGLADWLGRAADLAADGLRALLASIRAGPRSIGALLAFVLAWVAGLPGRVAGWIGAALAALRGERRSVLRSLARPWILVAAVATVALVAGGFVAGGLPGALAALAVVLVAGSLWRRGRHDEPAGPSPASPAGASDPAAAEPDGPEAHRPTLRELWRTLARWVMPGRWRARTPGEIGRAAVDRGLPREPVEELTDIFREVEYGDRPLSETRRERARAAFEAVRTARSDEERDDR